MESQKGYLRGTNITNPTLSDNRSAAIEYERNPTPWTPGNAPGVIVVNVKRMMGRR